MKPILILSTVLALGLFAGCDSNDNSCPATQPQQGTQCSHPGVSQCTYVVELCPCDTYDLHAQCSCEDGEWNCTREYDCRERCGDAGGV